MGLNEWQSEWTAWVGWLRSDLFSEHDGSMTDTETPYGVGWYGDDASIAQTGYVFRLKEDAVRFATDGATAYDS